MNIDFKECCVSKIDKLSFVWETLIWYLLNCPVDSLVLRVAKAGHLDSSLVDKFGGLLAPDSDGDDHDDNAVDAAADEVVADTVAEFALVDDIIFSRYFPFSIFFPTSIIVVGLSSDIPVLMTALTLADIFSDLGFDIISPLVCSFML